MIKNPHADLERVKLERRNSDMEEYLKNHTMKETADKFNVSLATISLLFNRKGGKVTRKAYAPNLPFREKCLAVSSALFDFAENKELSEPEVKKYNDIAKDLFRRGRV